MTISPQFLAEYEPLVQPQVGTGAATFSVSVAASDRLVIIGTAESSTVTLNTPTGGGLTYALQVQSPVTASRNNVYIWTTTAASAQTFTMSVTPTNASSTTRWSIRALRFSNIGSYGATASNTGTGTAPSLTLTTTQAYSSIIWASSDFLAADGAARTYNVSTAGAFTEDDYDRAATFITDYVGHYASPGAAGAETVGVTAPTAQNWSAVALELIGLSGTARTPTAQPADTTSLTDAATLLRTTQTGPGGDTASLTDSAVASRGYNNVPADTTSLTDAVTASRETRPADVAGITDAVTIVKTVKTFPADRASLTDDGGTPASAYPNTAVNIGRLTTDSSIIAILARPDIASYQFLIDAEPYCAFGNYQTVNVSKFDMGSAAIRNQDQPGGLQDTVSFGTDRHTPGAFTWDLFTDAGNDPLVAEAWVDLMARVWDHDVRQTPNGALPLRYNIGGRIRRVYGRPRRWSPIPDGGIQYGKVKITADFQLSEDSTFYDDTEQSTSLGITQTVVSGSYWTFPIIFPLASLTPGPANNAQMIIGGTQKTWVKPVFYGPVSNPYVTIAGAGFNQRWQLNGDIAAGDTLTLSGRPWDMGIRSSTGVAHPEMLDPRSRLSQLRLKPGTYTATFGGVDLTTTSHCALFWRPAYRSL